ncbi:unnamed protein product [Thelazia callipaeda]|uniref:7TM_GPCR_Srx domain-containing protein n=1 Tax=Thelazia callipaeda TaxID=103827 RepID=A0A0N5D7R2_THECL|nr:unnamed protein product [Thelazia callipaeda]
MKHCNKSLKLTSLLPLAFTQVIIVLLSNRIHSQIRSGGLYLLRLFDFLTTLTIMKFSKCLLGSDNEPPMSLLTPVALSGSLSWLELSVIEYDYIALLLSPVLAILQGFQVLQIKKCYRNLRINQPQVFIFLFTGLTSATLLIPAYFSWLNSTISSDASWEPIDYLLVGMSIIFMPNYKYSEIWLQLNLTAYDYMVLEQTKFWLASMGQWYLQNMAHATIFALAGKILMLGALGRYFAAKKYLAWNC